MHQEQQNTATGAVLKVGAGIGKILLPASYFVTSKSDGTIEYEDGFNGSVHTFQGHYGPVVDNPCIRVLVLECEIRTAIVAMEIAQAPEDQIAYTKAIVHQLCGVEEENIWIHSTHQFGFMHRPGNAKKAAYYDEAMKAAVTEAANAAMATLQTAVLGVGTGICNVSANRNIPTPEGVEGGPYSGFGSTLETNKTMTVLRFDADDGKPIAFFLSYGTKPSALCITGKTVGNRELNSEVTGHASKLLEEEFGAPCIFCMPGAADQYPRETAQYHGFDENGVWKKFDIGFEEGIKIVDRLGNEMGRDAVCIAKEIACNISRAKIDTTATTFLYPNKNEDGEIAVSAQAMVLGDVAFVGFKQEMDCATERQIQEASPYGTTLLVSFLNGDGKYFGHLGAYDFNHGKGTCETTKSPFAKGAAEKFVQIATDMLVDLKQGRKSTATAEEIRSENIAKIKNIIELSGHEWLVLVQDEKKMLVISRDVLECRAFHDELADITWEKSNLRKYLNGEWLDRMLTEKERARVIEVTVETPANTKYGIRGGGATRDKVFLLSLSEAEHYFAGNSQWLKARTHFTKEPMWWYLRSMGEAANVAASVTSGGQIDYHGTANGVNEVGGIRPAMWLSWDFDCSCSKSVKIC